MPYVHPERRMNLGGQLHDHDDELPALHDLGFRAFVCLLNTPSDVAVFESAGFLFRFWPVPNGLSPSLQQAVDAIKFIDHCRLNSFPVAIYCEAGLCRTGTVIASYLIHEGKSAKEAIRYIRTIEPSAIETVHQIKFLEEFERSHP